MHEMSIALAVIGQVEEAAERAGDVTAVRSVRLRVGELAGVVPDALDFAFEVAREGTALAGARLVVEQVTARAYCDPCAEEFEVGMPPFFWCPRCDRPTQELRSGRELEIIAIESAPSPS